MAQARSKRRTERDGSALAAGEEPVRVGWMGVSLTCPPGWSPVSVSGEGESGYLKVISPDTRFLEVKWEQPRGIVSVPQALDAYLDRLRKAARKSRQEIEIKLRPRGMGGIRARDQAPISYTWQADRQALGCIWHCGQCNRLVIAELVGQAEDDLTIAAEILRGIADHGSGESGDRWNSWALYGLNVEAPERFRMEKHSLMTGHQHFQLRDRGSTLCADRWGLAEIALRGTDLRTWFEARESGVLSRYTYRVEETEMGGHAAYRLAGREHVLSAAWRIMKAASTLVWPRFFFEGYVWECPETNRIFAVVGEQARGGTLVREVAERVGCHRASGR